MKFEIYRHKMGAYLNQYGWRLKSPNGKIIAIGGESYHNRNDCLNAVALVMDTGRATTFLEV